MATSLTSNKCCSPTQVALIVTGVVAVAGLAAFTWSMLSRRDQHIDPLEEADRRLDELEESLHRLQSTFRHAVGA